MAKCFCKSQPAPTAQTDMGGLLLVNALNPLLTEYGSHEYLI